VNGSIRRRPSKRDGSVGHVKRTAELCHDFTSLSCGSRVHCTITYYHIWTYNPRFYSPECIASSQLPSTLLVHSHADPSLPLSLVQATRERRRSDASRRSSVASLNDEAFLPPTLEEEEEDETDRATAGGTRGDYEATMKGGGKHSPLHLVIPSLHEALEARPLPSGSDGGRSRSRSQSQPLG